MVKPLTAALERIKMIPKLKKIKDLLGSDFHDHKLWIAVYSYDSDKSWYSSFDIDETTYRPIQPEEEFDCTNPQARRALIAVSFLLADRASFSGFSYAPEFIEGEIKTGINFIQPQITIDEKYPISFWDGNKRLAERSQKSLLKTIEKSPEEIFPLVCRPQQNVIDLDFSLIINGFSYLADDLISIDTLV